MYRFVLRPKWLLSHLFALVMITAMLFAGFWQLDRLDQRQTQNDLVLSRADVPLTPFVDQVVTLTYDDGEDIEFRAVEVTGEYRPDDQVLVANRSLNGAPGYWVLTPLDVEDGRTVVVNRGWIPLPVGTSESLGLAAPPTGSVEVSGIVRATETAQGLQVADRAEGTLDVLNRPDLERYRAQLDYDILPVYVELQEQVPAPGDVPVPLEPPDLGQGPHLGYAVQWFIFAAIGLVGYPLILRHIARRRARAAAAPDEAPPAVDDVPAERLRVPD